MEVQIHGVDLTLMADRGVYWNDQRTLLVADTHFGKEATFRRHGIGVPTGSTDATLAAVGRMLDQTGAIRLVILGDLFHARSSLAPDVKISVTRFLDHHDTVEFVLIGGNHDAHVGPLPQQWPIEVWPAGRAIGPVALGHHPGRVPDGSEILLCGHIHPAVRVSSHGDSVGKLPCFWLSDGCLVLPAIGDFTGTHAISPGRGDRIWLVAGDEIIPHPVAGANRLAKGNA